MLNSEIIVGRYYAARVSNCDVVLRVDEKIGVETRHGGNRTKFRCWNMRTNRERVTTAAKLRREVPPPVAQPKPEIVQDTSLTRYKLIGRIFEVLKLASDERLAEHHNQICSPPIEPVKVKGGGRFE